MLKQKLFFTLIFTIFISTNTYAYDQYVHMYITYTAYQLLKSQGYCIPEMEQRLGTITTCGNHPWEWGMITTGAYREDEEDVVFGIHQPLNWQVTNTHFWDADISDDYESTIIGAINNPFPNAYKKARYFWNGDWKDDKNNYAPSYIYIPYLDQGYYMYMYKNGLAELQRTGVVWYGGFLNTDGSIDPHAEWKTVENNVRNAIVWEVLGRMCHLLQDQTVPAHAHVDNHMTGDCYEDWITSNHWQYDISTAGQFINPYVGNNGNPLRYLYYSANQIGDYWPSDPDCNSSVCCQWIGDVNYQQGIYPKLDEMYNTLITIPWAPLNPSVEGNINYNYAIRATAGLLYLFAVSAGLQQNNNPPVFQSFSFNKPDKCVYWGEQGILTASIANANSYGWQYYKCGSTANGCGNYSPLPDGLQIYGYGNTARIVVLQNYVNQACNSSYPYCGQNPQALLNFIFKVTAIQSPCWFEDFMYPIEIKPVGGIRPHPQQHGCPYLYVWNSDSTLFFTENNLLNKSEKPEYVGQDIEDVYKINKVPGMLWGKYALQIGESDNDQDFIDKVSLLAVDHPEGTVATVTQSNQIAIYEASTVISTDLATQNSGNITPLVQYNYLGRQIVNGTTGDSIYAHYDTTSQLSSFRKSHKRGNNSLYTFTPDSVSLIGQVDEEYHGGNKGTWTGFINIYGNGEITTKNFAARQYFSEIVIPYSNMSDAIDHVDVTWNTDYALTYFSVVPIAFTGFDIQEIPLNSAIYSIDNEDVSSSLLNIDRNYLELDSGMNVALFFDSIPPPPQGMVRDYVFRINGRYSAYSGTAMNKNKLNALNENNNAIKFYLYDNYPNPFNPQTEIRYDVAKNTMVKLTIFNILGQLVSTLVDEVKTPGSYLVKFDGSKYASGVYIYKLEAGDYTASKKMLLIK